MEKKIIGDAGKLSTKALKRIIKDNRDIREFQEALMSRIKEYNQHARTFDRPEEHRRYDAISRLIVGDEKCAALAFDGEKLYVSTNQNNHRDDTTSIKIRFEMKGNRNNTFLKVKPIICLYHDDKLCGEFYSGKKIKYKRTEYIKKQIIGHANIDLQSADGGLKQYKLPVVTDIKVVKMFTNNATSFKFTTQFSEHKIDGLPEISTHLSLKPSFQFAIEPYAQHSGDKIETAFIIDSTSKIDPFRHRVEKLIEHLQMVALIALREKQKIFDDEKIRDAKFMCEEHRAPFLNQSLAWEARSWMPEGYKITIHPYDRREEQEDKEKFDREKAQLNELSMWIEALCNDFLQEKKIHDIGRVGSGFVKLWKNKLIQKIKKEEFSAPMFVKVNPEAFLDKVWHYFRDIEKLEEYVEEDVREEGLFSKMLLKDFVPYGKKTMVEVIDHLEDGVHAEMRLLYKFMNMKQEGFYISTSKLCCASCSLAINIGNKFGISGTHCQGFKWPLGQELHNEDFLKKFLGEALFEKYSALGEELKFNDGKNIAYYQKKDIAYHIVESISQLEGGVQQYSSNEVSHIAEDSDEEEFLSNSGCNLDDILHSFPYNAQMLERADEFYCSALLGCAIINI